MWDNKNPLWKKIMVTLWNSLVQYCGNCRPNELLEGSDLPGVGGAAVVH